MNARTDFVGELTSAIRSSVESGSWTEARTDLTALSEQVLGLVVSADEEELSRAYRTVERTYTALVTANQIDTKMNARTAAAELESLTRMLTLAIARKEASAEGDEVQDPNLRPLLDKLWRNPAGMSGRELAEALLVRPETIARKLPVLRAAGLVRSQQVGKAMINTLTDTCRAQLDQEAHASGRRRQAA